MADPSSKSMGLHRKRIRHAMRRDKGEKIEEAATTRITEL
jgi:hypothetical protein